MPNPKMSGTRWYRTKGWKVINRYLSEFKDSRIVWVENFTEIERGLQTGLTKKDFVFLFNQDSPNWKLVIDGDGVLYATPKN